MNIGLVCPYSFERAGGVQNHVLGLAQWLQAQGHRTLLLAPGFPDAVTVKHYDLTPAQFTNAGKPTPVAINGSVARVTIGPGSWRRTKKWLDTHRFDVLHVHEPYVPGVALWATRQATTPVVGTFHTSHGKIRGVRQLSEAARLNEALDAAIAVSREAASVAETHYGVVATVIGNGLNIAGHEAVTTTGPWRGGDRPLITFIGRYGEPRKGFDIFVDAMSIVRHRYPEMSVVVIGQGEPRHVAGFRFLGGVDDDRRNQVLSETDVYVAPQTGNESFGIVLIEALASGAPVVASDLPAFEDVLTDSHGIIGHTFAAGDAKALAAAVLRSLAEPRDYRLQRGRERAQDFDWNSIGPQILRTYDHAVGVPR